MKLLKRLRPLFAAAAVVALALVLMHHHALPQTDKATGTQSDPHVGTSKYPAPKAANTTPPSIAISDPSAIPALTDINAKCDWAKNDSAARPSLQDDGVGAQTFADMPQHPSTDTMKCAIARAKAAGFVVTGGSVKCTEAVVELLDNGKTWKFRPFCMNVSPAANPTCVVNLVPTDYQGNFFWSDQPSFRHQNTSAEYVRNLGSFAGC